jgi:hypothetical protein
VLDVEGLCVRLVATFEDGEALPSGRRCRGTGNAGRSANGASSASA